MRSRPARPGAGAPAKQGEGRARSGLPQLRPGPPSRRTPRPLAPQASLRQRRNRCFPVLVHHATAGNATATGGHPPQTTPERHPQPGACREKAATASLPWTRWTPLRKSLEHSAQTGGPGSRCPIPGGRDEIQLGFFADEVETNPGDGKEWTDPITRFQSEERWIIIQHFNAGMARFSESSNPYFDSKHHHSFVPGGTHCLCRCRTPSIKMLGYSLPPCGLGTPKPGGDPNAPDAMRATEGARAFGVRAPLRRFGFTACCWWLATLSFSCCSEYFIGQASEILIALSRYAHPFASPSSG